jgi:hypothetical protein
MNEYEKLKVEYEDGRKSLEPITVNGRQYFLEAELEDWERERGLIRSAAEASVSPVSDLQLCPACPALLIDDRAIEQSPGERVTRRPGRSSGATRPGVRNGTS